MKRLISILILILIGCNKSDSEGGILYFTFLPPVYSPPVFRLNAPQNLEAYGADQRCQIRWMGDIFANNYVIFRSTETGFTPTSDSLALMTFGSDMQIVDMSLSNDTPLYYRVRAEAPEGSVYTASPYSEEVACTPTASINTFPPRLINFSAGDEENTIQFQIEISFANNHTLYWSNTPGVTTSSNKIENISGFYLHTNLINGQAYYYRLSTHDPQARETGLGPEFSATPRISVPQPPTGLSAQPIEGGLRISWSPSAKAASYDLYWSYSPGVSTSSHKVANVTSSYDLTGLTIGKYVYYRIEAINASGTALSDESSQKTVQMSRVPAAVALDVTGTAGDRYSTFEYSDEGYTVTVKQYTGTNDGISGTPVLYAVQTLTFNRTYDRIDEITYDVSSGTTDDRFVTFQYADASSRPSLVKVYKGGLDDTASLIEIREYQYNGAGSPTCTRTADGADITNSLWTYAYNASSTQTNGYKAGSCASPSSHYFVSTAYLDGSGRMTCADSSALSGSIWYDSILTYTNFDSFNNPGTRYLTTTGTCESPGSPLSTYTYTYEYSGSLLVCQSNVPSPSVQKWTLSDGLFTEYLNYSSGSCGTPGTLSQKYSLTGKIDAVSNPYLSLVTGMAPNANGNVTERYSNFLRGSGFSGYGAPGYLAP